MPRFFKEQCYNSDQYIIIYYKYDDVRGQILVFNQSDNTSRTYMQLQKGHFSLLVYAAVLYPHTSVLLLIIMGILTTVVTSNYQVVTYWFVSKILWVRAVSQAKFLWWVCIGR